MIRKEDELWKGLLDEIFPDFIRFIYPAADQFLDLNKGIEFLDKELEQLISHENLPSSTRIVDKLVKVYTHDGQEEYILVHIEVQAKYSKDFAKRMFTYFYRLLDKYNKPVSAFAIFTEANDIARSDTYKSEFMGTELMYRFKTYKITADTDEELEANENPFALVVLAARTAFKGKDIKDKIAYDLFKKDWKIELFKKLQAKKVEEKKANAIWNFINFYIPLDFEATKDAFKKEFNNLNKTNKIMGIEEVVKAIIREEGFEMGKTEGKAEGKAEGKKERDLELKQELTRRYILNFGYSNELISKLLHVSIKFIEDLRTDEFLIS